MRLDADGFEEYEAGDAVLVVIDGVEVPAEVSDPRDGFELEVALAGGATTAHVTELRALT